MIGLTKSLRREKELAVFLNSIEPIDQYLASEELNEDQLQGIVAAGREAFMVAPQSFQAIFSPRFNPNAIGPLSIDSGSFTIYDRLIYDQRKARLPG
jgi:hypothetical protein